MKNRHSLSLAGILKVIFGITLIPISFLALNSWLGFASETSKHGGWIGIIVFNLSISAILTLSTIAIARCLDEVYPWQKANFPLRIATEIAVMFVMAALIMFLFSLGWFEFTNTVYDSKDIFYNIFIAVVITLMATVIFEGRYIFDLWKSALLKEKVLEQEKLKAQLEVLKGQITPHFLFNTLNGIYVLINKNPDLARKAVLQFSDLLSHQVYDFNADFLPLAKEIEYLQNYIALEMMRQGNRVILSFEYDENLPHTIGIPPGILIVFVENAFKHGLKSEKNPYKIDIKIESKDQNILFYCQNEINSEYQALSSKGVGLQNVKQRLKLLYPYKHSLEIIHHPSNFEIKLLIPSARI